MSLNQSRAEKCDEQLKKPGRSGSSSQQQRSFFAGKGGGGTTLAASSSSSANRSFRKSANGQGGQSRVGFTVANSVPTTAVTAFNSVQNGSHLQSQLSDAAVSGNPKPTDSSLPRSPQGLPRGASSQSTAGSSASTAPTTPSKGDIMSGPFPLQFGSISPGVMNGMQIPARTSSAPPNLDEQKRNQARHDSFRALPTAPKPIPTAPKQQQQQQQQQHHHHHHHHQLRKNVGTLNQSNPAESHLPEPVKREANAQNLAAPAAATAQKSSGLPVAGMSVPMTFRPPQVPLQFGGPTSQIQSQAITPSSLKIPMPLPVGNASQVQQQVFVPGFQTHCLQPQGLMHQGQSLGFAPQMGHQLVSPLANLGIGMPPQFPQQQAGKFGGLRKPVKITHPETHEELKLDKRTESYMDVGSSGPRSHPNMPAQSQPVTPFPVNYYSHMQPNPYNSNFFFPTSTSLPLTSNQMTPGSLPSGYNYTGGQGVQNISFMNPPALNRLPFNKAGHSMAGKSESGKLEHVHDGHAVVSAPPTSSVQGMVTPGIGSLPEKRGNSSIMLTSPVNQIYSPKLLKQPGEANFIHHVRDSEIDSENFVQQPKSDPESSGPIPLPATVKHSTSSVAVSTQGVSPSASSVPLMPAEGSASVLINAESRRRESVKRSNSLKEQQKKPSKKEVRHFQQKHQPDSNDTAGSMKLPLLEMSVDSSFSDLSDSQGHTNPDENVHAPSESAGISLTTLMELNFSSSLEHNCCPVVRVSESEDAKTVSSKSVTSEVILGRGTEASQGPMNNCIASKTTTDGAQLGHRGSCEQSCPSDFKVDKATSGKSDATCLVKQDGSAPLKAGIKQEITETVEHRQTDSPDYSPKHSRNPTGGSAVSESYDCGNHQPEEMSQVGAAIENMQETDVDESSCTKTDHIDMNVEAVSCSSEVDRTNDYLVLSATTPSGSMFAEAAISPLADFHKGRFFSADASKIASGKSTAGQEEVAPMDSGMLGQETAHTALSVLSKATWKLEGRGTDSSSGNQVSASLLASKDRITGEQNNAKGHAAKKKKKKDTLKKADAVGRTSDLYMAYKGPEEKHGISVSSECKDNTRTADAKQASTDNIEKDVVATEDEGKSESEVDDWEDAAEISTPKLKALENREQLRVTQKQNDGYGSGITGKKKYSTDFLLTFSELCTDLPAGFEFRSDLVDVLPSGQGAASHLVGRESYPNTGRIVDRPTGGSRLERRGSGIMDDDRWSKLPGPFSSGRDPHLDVGFGSTNVSFRPGQGGNHGVLRNPRGQSPGQYGGGILAGPMQSLASPAGMPRNSPDADRWQRATGIQRGLIPSPQTPLQVMHKADKKYEVGKVSDEEDAKQRQLKGILNKLTPQNFDKLFEKVIAVNIDNTTTLTGVISQIFDKALKEPTFCEMYANFCFHLANELPEFSEDNERKVTFKRLLLNKCQEEFERGEREQAEANRDEEGEIKLSEEEKEEKKVQARRRMLGNIRLIGELYKKRMLSERIMHQCITKLLGQYPNPDEEDIEALCKLMSTIGEMIDHPKVKELMDDYFKRMLELSNDQKLSSRLRFMLKDAIDLRKNSWQQRRKVEGPKKIEEVHRDAAQERQAQVTRLSRGSSAGSSARRGLPLDYGARGSTAFSSPSFQQMGPLRGLPPQVRGYGTQDVRMEDWHPFENRIPSVPLPQRPVDDDSMTLGPQGGLARVMSVRGHPLMSNAPLADVSSSHYDSRRIVSTRNGYSSVSDCTSYDNSRVEMPRYVPDRIVAPLCDQSNSQESNAYSGSSNLMNAIRSFDRSPASGPGQGLSTGAQNAPSEPKVSMEKRLQDLSISAIRAFYSARNEEEVRLCVKDLNSPSFYPEMVTLWVTDSFDRKNGDRDLLAKLLVNLCKSQESLLNQTHLIKGFESALSSLEDAVTDSPKAAEYLGRIFGMVVLENALSLKEIGRLIHGGGEEPGSLLQSGLASDVLVSVLEYIRGQKGDTVLKEIRTSSNLRLEDFRSPDRLKSRKLDAFI